MDGLTATRLIRSLERSRTEQRGVSKAPRPAVIIALTGLASSQDATEAFTSGMDLFMTKPVKFSKLGDVLDDWELKGGRIRSSQGLGKGEEVERERKNGGSENEVTTEASNRA